MLISPVSETIPALGQLTNLSWPVEQGDRIAQLVIEKIETPSIVEVDVCVV